MRRYIRSFILLVSAIAGVAAYLSYQWIFSPNTSISEPYDLYISHQMGYDEVQRQLKSDSVLLNYTSFDQVSRLMKYHKDQVPSGKYVIQPGWSNRQIISILRAGIQQPVKVTISTARTLEDIAGVVAERIEPDSTKILNLLKDSVYLLSYGFTPQTSIGMIIPDTYEMYWNIDAKGFLSRMKSEYDKFWSQNNRMALLENSQLSKNEASTLASIVEKETNVISERPTIAGVYLNRIKQGILLQADPTVVFAVGDFDIRRVLNVHLQIDSPYNTYKYLGLPPGPICMPSKSSLDAVLNAETHDYIFFCAKPGYNGEHSFAKTNAQHERNAAEYRKWLNQERILK